MEKIKIKNTEFQLIGKSIEIGQTLSFKAKDKNNQDFYLNNIKGMKVISTFPALNTSICDKQTMQIAEWASKFKNVNFISITMDPIQIISQWCIFHSMNNVLIVSDLFYKEFAMTTNLIGKEWNKLARGFMILDENNKIIAQSYFEEQALDPDYNLVKSYLK